MKKNIFIVVFIITLILIILINISFSQNYEWEKCDFVNSPEPRFFHQMLNINDDKIILFGGAGEKHMLNDCWILDLLDKKWEQIIIPKLNIFRFGFRTAKIDNNRILIFGGGGPGNENNDTWVYNISQNKFELKNHSVKPEERTAHGLINIGNGNILLFGGCKTIMNFNFYFSDTWIYSSIKDKWTILSTNERPALRANFSITKINNNKVLLYGGCYDYELNDSIYTDFWIFNISEKKWSQIIPQNKPTLRVGEGIAALDSDMVLLFGGYSANSNDSLRFLDDTWIYKFKDNKWEQIKISNYPNARSHFDMVKLYSNNSVLLFGGRSIDGSYNDIWLFKNKNTGYQENIYLIDDIQFFINSFSLPNMLTINYKLLSPSQVKIDLFDLNYRLIDNLLNSYQPEGSHYVNYNTSNLVIGLYIIRLNESGKNNFFKFIIYN